MNYLPPLLPAAVEKSVLLFFHSGVSTIPKIKFILDSTPGGKNMNPENHLVEDDFENRNDANHHSTEALSADRWEATRNRGQARTRPISRHDYTELKYRDPKYVSTANLAHGLGIFSIALGVAKVVMPKAVARWMGLGKNHLNLVPLLGAREIAQGIGVLQQTKPTESIWFRVAGDAMDLAVLQQAAQDPTSNPARLGAAAVMVLGVTALDIACGTALCNQQWSEEQGNPLAPTTLGQSSARRSVDRWNGRRTGN
jgi:hypothetical protein